MNKEKELKIFKFDENEKYSREYFLNIFEENKTTIKYKNYFKEEVEVEFIFLEQNKKITISNYPYGYLRTDIKYSIETTKSGGRFVSQTLNPKTNIWNKEKKKTYSDISFLVVNKEGKITTFSLDTSDGIEKINLFYDLFKDVFNDFQKKQILKIKAYKKVMEKVNFSVHIRKFKNIETGEIVESINFDEFRKYIEVDDAGNPVDKELEKQKDNETKDTIINALNYEYKKLKQEEY